MAKIKVAIWGTPLKSVFIDPNATQGATIGVDLFMPDGSVATITALIAALGGTGTGTTTVQAHRLLSGLTLGDDHPQYLRKDTLTTAGDMYTATGPGVVIRLGIGTNHQVLMSTGTAPAWTTLFANPTAQVGLTTINGSASTAMRSDGAPALDQGIVPHWTGQHTFDLTPLVGAVKVVLESRQINTDATLTGGGDLTANRTLGINLTYPGQTSIVTLGTITTGVWNGTKITYPNLQNVTATARFLGRITAGSGVIEELTGTQATTLLNVFTTLLQGLVPASGGGTTNYLRADGTFSAPPGATSGTVTSVSIVAPAAGITQSGSPITTAGSITLALANDLAALEGLGSTGIAVRTAADTWAQRTITGTAARISVTNGNGVSGNPIIDIDATYVGQSSITTLGTITTGVWAGTAIDLAAHSTGILPAASFPALTGDVTTIAGALATTIANNAVTTVKINANAVTLAKLATQADQTILGNNSGGAAVPSALTASQVKTLLAISLTTDVSGTLQAAQEPAHTGDVTNSAGSLALTIAAGAVTLAKMANLAANSIIGNNTGSPATPIALTTAQVKTLLAIAYTDVSGLATVAHTGAYSDLTGTPTIPTGANPSASVILSAVNGSAATFMRSDGAPALSQAIAPTWTAKHIFSPASGVAADFVAAATSAPAIRVIGSTSISGVPALVGAIAQFVSADSTATILQVDAIAAVPTVLFRRANGTGASPSAVALNDVIGLHSARAFGTTAYGTSGRASITYAAAEAWTDTAQGTKVSIQTTPIGGIVTQTSFLLKDTGEISTWGPTAAALVDLTPDHGTFTGTLTGFTATITGTCRWNRVGDCVYLFLPVMTGTSNTTGMTLTGAPAAILPARLQMFPVGDLENNTILTGTFAGQIGPGGTLTFYTNGNAAGFTASGTKGLATAQVVVWTLF